MKIVGLAPEVIDMATRVERRRRASLAHEGWAHGHLRPLDVRQGDDVVVLSGKDKGRRGVVERLLPGSSAFVRGVNLLKRHTKSGVKGNIQGGVVDFDGPVAYRDMMLVCNRSDKPTRIARGERARRRMIVCKKCGETYDGRRSDGRAVAELPRMHRRYLDEIVPALVADSATSTPCRCRPSRRWSSTSASVRRSPTRAPSTRPSSTSS